VTCTSGDKIRDVRRFSGVLKSFAYEKMSKKLKKNRHTGETEREGVWGRGGVEPTIGFLLGVFNLQMIKN
jgi:hypothetical protein